MNIKKTAFENFREFMMAANAKDQWLTLYEMRDELRKQYGLRCLPADVLGWLHDMSKEGFTVATRKREYDARLSEYRIYRQN